MVHCRIWDRCIVGFVNLIYCCVAVGEQRTNFARAYLGLVTPEGYSLYVGWYGCAAVLTPFFWHSGDWTRSFWGTFSHPPTPKWSFGVLKLPILTEFDLFGPKFHFSLNLFGCPIIFLGPIFSGQRHIPIGFRTEYHHPLPTHPRAWGLACNTPWLAQISIQQQRWMLNLWNSESKWPNDDLES